MSLFAVHRPSNLETLMTNAWASPESDDENMYSGLYDDYNPNPTGMMQYLFSFDGRIGRGTYWLSGIGGGILIMMLFIIPAVIVAAVTQSEAAVNVLVLIAYIPLTWMNLAVAAKRWHDRGKSGWWSLIGFVPIIGSIWIIVECGLLEGDFGDNEYGPAPL
jgi:uncharacterized membrane protein YhaH (DUF805 family)